MRSFISLKIIFVFITSSVLAQDNHNDRGLVIAKSENISVVLRDQKGPRTVHSFFSVNGSWTSTDIPDGGQVVAKVSQRFATVQVGNFLSVFNAAENRWVQAPYKAKSPEIIFESTYVLVVDDGIWAFSSIKGGWSSMSSPPVKNNLSFSYQEGQVFATQKQRSQLEQFSQASDSKFKPTVSPTLRADIAAIGISAFPSEAHRIVRDPQDAHLREGRKFRAIESGEFDSFENPEEMRSLGINKFEDFGRMASEAERSRFSDDFRGTSRKASKTSISRGELEDYSTLDGFVATLIEDELMQEREPPIARGAGSRRVEEELRNVRVKAYILAASREDDNDYHVILGNSDSRPDLFFNVEISGLPASGPYRHILGEARSRFKTFFSDDLPGLSYKFYEPPIPVTVTGSLFFDIDHRGGTVGPARFRPPSAWEIHPVTNMEFNE